VIPSRLQFFAIGVILLFLLWLLSLIRKQRIPLQGSLSLVLSTILALAIACFPNTLLGAASFLGFEVASNALFVLGFIYVLWNIVSITVALANMSRRTTRLTQECSMLRAELEGVRARMGGSAGGDESR
jgi:hypothetical protein